MAAVLHYKNFNGEKVKRAWGENDNVKFNALIKLFVETPGTNKMQIIEKPSKRPATYQECCMFAKKIMNEYGASLKQLIIWNMDEIKNSNWWNQNH